MTILEIKIMELSLATWVENIEGCTDELACNYNESANINDGTCEYSCNDIEIIA